ncbi:MAG: Na/Pi cotransporter family protein [Clostridia bacterium]|nr:Na/Pi cotransporter family protein [Clostridia bacterium]
MILPLLGGLCLFLFGMNTMGESLERRAGGALKALLGRLTTNKIAGFLTGLGVTAVIQSSSATTVMVVGFVNSGLMTLRQAINVIMGANIGTTITAWILSLAGIDGGVWVLDLLKPTSFSPILALIGIALCMFFKDDKKKDVGLILLGFATLMFGMDMMSDAVSGLKDEAWFGSLFTKFNHIDAFGDIWGSIVGSVLGLLAGAILTAIIQSSSASVGILQALSATGAIPFGAAIPIIMGQNIGTCVTAMLSSAGTTKNAKRAAVVHLSFNVIGATVLLILFTVAKVIFFIPMGADNPLATPASEFTIAIAHSVFNVICVALLLPASSLLEKLACKLVPDAKTPETVSELDERLLATPSIALERCRVLTMEMAETASTGLAGALDCLNTYNEDTAKQIREAEDRTDHYEDILGTYLVKLGSHRTGESNSAEATELLRLIGDFERIADHSVNILESSEELRDKNLKFSENAQAELCVMTQAVAEILDLTMQSLRTGDLAIAAKIEPLEQVIDDLKEELRTRHIVRLTQGNCSIEVGFVWSDLLTNLERVSDHCSNVAACIIDTAHHNLNLHESTRSVHQGDDFYNDQLAAYREQYTLA